MRDEGQGMKGWGLRDDWRRMKGWGSRDEGMKPRDEWIKVEDWRDEGQEIKGWRDQGWEMKDRWMKGWGIEEFGMRGDIGVVDWWRSSEIDRCRLEVGRQKGTGKEVRLSLSLCCFTYYGSCVWMKEWRKKGERRRDGMGCENWVIGGVNGHWRCAQVSSVQSVVLVPETHYNICYIHNKSIKIQAQWGSYEPSNNPLMKRFIKSDTESYSRLCSHIIAPV